MESLWSGRTLGKAALGLRVVTVEGGPVRVRQSATRAIVGVFELWATFGSVAVLATILTRDNQRLGDLLAGTLVLRERAAMSTTATAMSFPAPYGYADYVASIDVSVLTSDQYGVIRTFLMRVLDLTIEARGALAVNLANSTALDAAPHPAGQRAPRAVPGLRGLGLPGPPRWRGAGGHRMGSPAAPPARCGGRPLRAATARQPGPPPAYAPPAAGYGQQPATHRRRRTASSRSTRRRRRPPAAGPRAAADVAAHPGRRPPRRLPGAAAAVGPAAGAGHAAAVRPPPAGAEPGADPGAPPRFDVPPDRPGAGPRSGPGCRPVAPVEPAATIGAEPAPWPPRKPGQPPASASTGAVDLDARDPTSPVAPVAPVEPAATIGAEPAPWPPRKPGQPPASAPTAPRPRPSRVSESPDPSASPGRAGRRRRCSGRAEPDDRCGAGAVAAAQAGTAPVDRGLRGRVGAGGGPPMRSRTRDRRRGRAIHARRLTASAATAAVRRPPAAHPPASTD